MAIIISDTEPRVQYTATAGQTSFTVPFEFFANADLKVFNGTTQLTFAASPSTASEYSVSGAGQTGGGSITLGGSGATLNDIITIYRDLAIERTTDFPTSGAFQINSLNTELDKIIAMAQQLERDLKFSPRAAATTSNTFNITFPNLSANKVLSVNSAGTGLEFAQDITDITTIAAIAGDVTAVSNIAANVTAVANDATDIGIVSTNIASINTVATNIADVITVANDLNEAISEVETVADDLNEAVSEIDTVSNNIAVVQTVGAAANIANISSVAGQISPTNNISTVAGATANIGIVAGQISPTNNIGTVAGINSQITTVAGLNTEIAGVYSISGQITAVNSNSSNINTVATNLLGSNTIGTVATDLAGSNTIGTVATNIASVQDVSSNIGSVNDFAARYRVSATAPTTSLDIGDLYYDTATDTMRVYGSSGWQNAGSSVNGTSQRYNYTATSGQTTFTGADNNGNTLAYDAGYIDVYLNGVKLLNGTDVTVTSGTSIVLATGATTGDIVDIVAYGTFSVASLNADNLDSGTVPSARVSGAYTGITQTGTLTSFASTGIDDNATSTAVTIDSSGNLLVGTTSNAPAQDNVTGVSLRATDPSEFSQDGKVAISLNRKTSDGEILRFRKDGTAVGSVGTRVNSLIIGSGDTHIGFFDSANSGSTDAITPQNATYGSRSNAIDLGNSSNTFKDLYLGGGLYVGGTASANHLDDYEEGSFTAELSSTGATFTYTVRQGWYVKVGNRVMFNIYIQLDGTPFTTTSNDTRITGLPFTSGNLSGNDNRMICGTRVVSFSSGQTFLMGNIGTNSNYVYLLQGGSGSPGVPLPSNALSNASGQIFLSGSYQTA